MQGSNAPSEHDKWLLEVLADDVNHELSFYWQRFTAFSALQAGLFVVATAKDYHNTAVATIGLVLALAWLLVRGASRATSQAATEARPVPAVRVSHRTQ